MEKYAGPLFAIRVTSNDVFREIESILIHRLNLHWNGLTFNQILSSNDGSLKNLEFDSSIKEYVIVKSNTKDHSLMLNVSTNVLIDQIKRAGINVLDGNKYLPILHAIKNQTQLKELINKDFAKGKKLFDEKVPNSEFLNDTITTRIVKAKCNGTFDINKIISETRIDTKEQFIKSLKRKTFKPKLIDVNIKFKIKKNDYKVFSAP